MSRSLQLIALAALLLILPILSGSAPRVIDERLLLDSCWLSSTPNLAGDLCLKPGGVVEFGATSGARWRVDDGTLVVTLAGGGEERFPYLQANGFTTRIWNDDNRVLARRPLRLPVVIVVVTALGMVGLAGAAVRGDTAWGKRAAFVGLGSWCVAALLVRLGGASLGLFWDAGIPLDAAWRITNGLVPHRDFSTIIGPLYFYLARLGFAVTGPAMRALDVGISFAFVVVCVWGFGMMTALGSAARALLATAVIGTFLITPRIMNNPPDDFGYVSWYNALGVGLMMFVWIGSLGPQRADRGRRIDRFVGFAVGAFAALACYTKISYGLIALVTIPMGVVVGQRSKEWLIGTIAGGLAAGGIVLVVMDFAILELVSDMRLTAAARGGSFWGEVIARTFQRCWIQMALVVAAAGAASVYARTTEGRFERPRIIRIWLIAGFIFSSGVFLAACNGQQPEFMIEAAVPFILFGGDGRPLVWRRFVYCVLGAALLWNSVSLNVRAGALLASRRIFDPFYHSRGVHNPVGIPDLLEDDAHVDWGVRFYDGFELVARSSSQAERVMVLDYPDLFSVAFGRTPPKGNALFWHPGFSFRPELKRKFPQLARARTFQDVDLIMKPLIPYVSTELFLDTYRGVVEKCFEEAARSQYWIMYRRVRDNRPCPLNAKKVT